MLNKISSMLDAVADSLEKKGLIKEAYEIDKIADSIDKPLNPINFDLGRAPEEIKNKINSFWDWYLSKTTKADEQEWALVVKYCLSIPKEKFLLITFPEIEKGYKNMLQSENYRRTHQEPSAPWDRPGWEGR
jgi:hypothetical protein